MKKTKRKGIKKRVKPKKARAIKVFIPHTPSGSPSFSRQEIKNGVADIHKSENSAWIGHGPVKWSDVQRPANLRNPSLAPGFRENVSPPGLNVNKPSAISQSNRKKAEQDR